MSKHDLASHSNSGQTFWLKTDVLKSWKHLTSKIKASLKHLTCCFVCHSLTHVADVTPGLYERIAEAGKNDLSGKVSGRDWPITGGTLSDEGLKAESGRDILLTGHEDGSVKFWSCSGIALSPLASVRTNKFFVGDDLDEPRGTFQAVLV